MVIPVTRGLEKRQPYISDQEKWCAYITAFGKGGIAAHICRCWQGVAPPRKSNCGNSAVEISGCRTGAALISISVETLGQCQKVPCTYRAVAKVPCRYQASRKACAESNLLGNGREVLKLPTKAASTWKAPAGYESAGKARADAKLWASTGPKSSGSGRI
jgi:hypothetical protein